MYTQCPDCGIAFKVTADVLKQAAGMVRCGGCQNAFNALSFLSESMPKQAAANSADASVPELRPEIIETDSPLPKTISAEQSAALLKTLDQLAGSDIRIEDTGVEWRVLDEVAESAADDVFIDEALEASETPIDEFLTDSPEVVDAPEIFDADANGIGKTSVDEIRFDDNTPLPDDFDLDDESSYISQSATTADPEPEPVVQMEPPAEFALSEADEWTDILDEFKDLGAEFALAPDEADVETGTVSDVSTESTPIDEPLDTDTQFALQAEEMGIDLSGINAVDEDLAEELVDDLEQVLADDAEIPGEEAELVEDLFADLDETESQIDEPEFEGEISDLDVIEELVEPVVESHTIEEELAMLHDEESVDDEQGESQHYVPPMTDEEHTVNMQIDQELMALAIEDKDGFASTIVIPEEGAERLFQKGELGSENDDVVADDKSGFETIVMEGEVVRSALDREETDTDPVTAVQLAELIGAKETAESDKSGSLRYRLVAGVVGLVVLFAIQMMHQSREALATIPAFNSTVGQFYSAIGQPVQPAWDITGWRIEATSDTVATNDGTESLTISSRIGNNSDKAMPYPLISISLSDRFLETIGGQILEPGEYLTTDLDPAKHVAPGNTFNAVISIESPSADATGYKLDVCYRLTDGRLRCAIADFK